MDPPVFFYETVGIIHSSSSSYVPPWENENGVCAITIVGVDVTEGENHRLHRFHTDYHRWIVEIGEAPSESSRRKPSNARCRLRLEAGIFATGT